MKFRQWGQVRQFVRLDNFLHGGILALAIALFLSLSIANILRGPASADDAWIALTAKNLATGKGYATSLSNSELVHFDPFISTGPSLVLPAALSVRMLGYAYWVPGTAQLAVFVVLFAIGVVLVVLRVGWTASSLFFAALTFLLTFASIKNWYFGALLGEPVAFAFIFLGMALLSCRQGRWSVLFAGVCFSFALLAKQIALFSIIGVVGAWLVLRYADRRGGFELINDLAVLALGVFSAAISFEVFKIFKLGVVGYKNTIEATLGAAIGTGGISGFADRIESFLGIAIDYYVHPVLPLLVLLSVLSAIWLLQDGATKERTMAKRLMFLGGSGAVLHFGYVLLFSALWPRYLWVGVAVASIAMAAVLLDATRIQRLAISFGFLIFLGGGGYGTAFELWRYMRSDPITVEREQVVEILSRRPTVPYAGEYWSSIYDIVFAMGHEGVWRFGPGLGDLREREFTAVINNVHTNKRSMFYRTVKDNCRPLMDSKTLDLFQCDCSFWIAYRTEFNEK